MELSRNHLKASRPFFLVYLQIIILLSCFNLLGLATANTSIRGNETDQQALLQFKAKITRDELRIMESWNSSIHFCQWRGVTCGRKHQRVTKLDLESLKLTGSLSPYVGNLSFLRELNLDDNNFYNQIPREIGGLRSLEILYLANNSINGGIPSNLSACSQLTSVDLENNQLTGEIPAFLSLLPNLKILWLITNRLRGRIPPSLGNLLSLQVLGLYDNDLSGIIPEALGRLTNLTFFSISGNSISGNVPTAMFNLSNIRIFGIARNKIQGTLPSDFAITMPHLEFFSIFNNLIYGDIPISISNATNMEVLQLNTNRLSGMVPSFENLDKLSRFILAENHLGYGREGDLNFLCTLVNKTKLRLVLIDANSFGGLFPECISNFSRTLDILSIYGNKILGRIPGGIGNLINLEVLTVEQNQLSGPIPFDIGRLQKLKIFSAYSNSLSGTIPNSIGNLTLLTNLLLNGNNLQGNIPSSLGMCQNLLLMGLSNNNLSGPIPPEILSIPSFSIALDLGYNSLTGELPVAVEKLKNLGQFYVTHNRLSGLIPNNLGSCVSIEILNLRGNLFEGPIPLSLSSLRGLVSLDVSDNNLSSGVPEFLASFGALKYLNLSFNDFEGVIPTEGVFKNASGVIVAGNDKLCGGIPELNLSRCPSKTSSNTSLKLKIKIVVVILGVTLLFTCLLILWSRKKKEKQPTTICAQNSLLQLSYQSTLKATDGFSLQNLVGSGSYGSVYKGILEESGAAIAVKVLNLLNRGASRSFFAECEALKNIRHRNLVKVLTAISGVDYQGNDFKALVYEFMANGSLDNWLHPSISINEPETMRNLNFFQRVNLAIDVAHALEYLHHHCETSIIHCDLKPSNILLDEEMVGHISDFGLAKILFAEGLSDSANHSYSLGLRGTIGYASPEYGMGSELSTKGDVYSYGILLLEIFTGIRPTNERFKEGLSLHNFVKAALPERMIEIIDPILLQERVGRGSMADISTRGKSLENEKHFQCLFSIFEIGLACSAESPRERIDMSGVVAMLCSTRDKLYPTRLCREVRS